MTRPTATLNWLLVMSPARQNPNDPAMTIMARGNELRTNTAEPRLVRAETTTSLPEPVSEGMVVALATRPNAMPAKAALAAVPAAPQPSRPWSESVVRSAATNQVRLRIARPRIGAAMNGWNW